MIDDDLSVDAVETIIDDDRWRNAISDPESLTLACLHAVSKSEPAVAQAGVAVLLADDAALRDLNRRFRGLDKPTNVLAFPAANDGSRFLGDLAIAYETCIAEAGERGVPTVEHAAHLIVHGVLHLVGYDHQDETEAKEMEALESEIMLAMRYADPHADRERAAANETGEMSA